MKITIEINTDNAAFEDNLGEVQHIIREIAKKIEQGRECGKCMDLNGNSVGEWEIEP